MLSLTTLVSSSVQIVGQTIIYQMSVMCVLVGSDGLIETGMSAGVPVDRVLSVMTASL